MGRSGSLSHHLRGVDGSILEGMATETTPDGPLTRLLVRFATHPGGGLRAARLLGIAFVGGLVVALGTSIAIVVADAGNPATLSIWVIVAFLGVKVPLLALLWWILGRRQRDDELSDSDLHALLARLTAATDSAARTPDPTDRLLLLREEAEYVAEHARDALRPDATALIERIDALVSGPAHPS